MSEPPAQRQYLCIDLKSFYASVECVDRGLDPLTTPLVVADLSRSEKTICLAVSPALRAKGVPGRARYFQIPKGLEFEVAPPRMARYIEVSAEVYGVYLRWVGKDDIHVYSIDEAFLDVTPYLDLYGMSARELGESIREDVVASTGIPATCGLGTNLYLAKIALDITAKHSPDFFGVLDEESYRQTLWNHRPLTDFWRVGPGIANRLEAMGIRTMGQLAVAPEEALYREFGKDAELLIDHAWGEEPCTMADIKSYHSKTKMLTSGQVFGCDKSFREGRTVLKEMVDDLSQQLVEARRVSACVQIWVGYALQDEERRTLRSKGLRAIYAGGPSSGGAARLPSPSNASSELRAAALRVYDAEVSHERPIHRMTVSVTDVVDEDAPGIQMDLFTDEEARERERRRQRAIGAVKSKFGKNSLLRGIDLLPEATARERNSQIGGHRSGE